MHDLTARQVDILKSLIEEYIETAEAVGSETLEKKHNLSASPATIRNEMVRLTDLGYLKKRNPRLIKQQTLPILNTKNHMIPYLINTMTSTT